MNRPVRRSDRTIDDEAALALLSGASYGVLSTAGRDGTPYAVPLSYVLRDGAIYFHCATEGRKLDNLAENPAVSFCVVGQTRTLPRHFSTEYESVIAAGIARPVEGDEKRAALVALLEKYSPDHLDAGLKYLDGKFAQVSVVRIDLTHLCGKARRPG